MYRCELCYTNVQKRNKTKHSQTKKHKYYSNLILKRYVIKNVEVIRIKDVFNPYYTAHTRKFVYFSLQVILNFDNDRIRHKITVSNNVTYNIESENYSTYTTDRAPNFLHRVVGIYLSQTCSPKKIPEIEIVFISDLKHIPCHHYLKQPKLRLCRKLIRRFHESTPLDFENKWLPDSFKDLWVCFTFYRERFLSKIFLLIFI